MATRLRPFREPRQRSESHLAFLRRLPCVACVANGGGASGPSQAAHLRSGSVVHGKQHGALALKPHDRWALPLCGHHHHQQHGMNELAFWKMQGVDPFLLAPILWGVSGDETTAEEVIHLNVRRG